jgi:hypothetical protein
MTTRSAAVGPVTVVAGAALILVAWAGVYLAGSVRAAGEPGFPIDDAWIHVRLARNVAAGSGLVFNPGEPAATSSAPLWSLILGAAAVAGVPFPWAAYLAGALGVAGLAGAALFAVRRATGDRFAAGAAALLVATTHPFPWIAVSGMESAHAALLLVLLIGAAAASRPFAALALAALAALARPELVLLVPVAGAGAWIRGRPRPPRAALIAAGTVAATVFPFIANRTLAGAWIPASFAAKVGRHGIIAALLERQPGAIPGIVTANLPAYGLDTLRALWDDNPVVLLLAIPGLILLARGGAHLPWLALVVVPAGVAVLAPFGGAAFHEQRYLAPLVAVAILAGGAAIGAFARRAGRAAGLLVLIAALAFSGAGAWRAAGRYAREVANITGMQVKVARWLAGRPGGPGLVATNDIGAIGALTGAPILDLTGLATPEIVPYLRRAPEAGERNRAWNGASEAGILDYLRRRRPAYVALFPSWYPGRSFQEALGAPVLRVDLEDNVICGDRTMLVFQPDWGR